MSYRTERKQQLSKQVVSRFRDMGGLVKLKDQHGKPRHPKDVARIRKHIEVDIAYLQRDLEALS